MESKMLVISVHDGNRHTNKAYLKYLSGANPRPIPCFPIGFYPKSVSKPRYARLNGGNFVVSLDEDGSLRENEIALNEDQCVSANTAIGNMVTIEKFEATNGIEKIEELNVWLEMDCPQGREIDAEVLAKKLLKNFHDQVMHLNQRIQFRCGEFLGNFTVNRIIAASNGAISRQGMLDKKTKIVFVSENLKIFNQALASRRIFHRNINFTNIEQDLMALGVGGMEKIFKEIFERVFSIRSLDPELARRLNIAPIRGILLYGPPGTGKTLLVKTIAKIIDAKPPKVIDGPQLLASLVGESESKVRELFREAREDFKKYGEQSPVHIIIFDEIDSIAPKRGTTRMENVTDRIVSQLLAMIDGMTELNNILIVGTTNRMELIDEALLRPGRLELHIKVDLPDEEARFNILKVHANTLEQRGYFQPDVNLEEIAYMTDGWSGADLAGVVRSAFSHALNRTRSDEGVICESQIRLYQYDFLHGIHSIR
ncbi:vesicle-fusing ATPase [Jatropha curcas]|uniref:vesicle-fusing ATPase n=1 Tax=Jatropha curcas TaxID=180498 RepID=UPI001895314D|nr:vesicle-fusing ATPase [Jatropha curcas]